MDVETLVGDRVTLRAWDTADAGWYVAARDDAVYRFTTERPNLTAAEVVEAIERARTSATTAAFAVKDEDNNLVGNLAVEFEGHTAEVSYFIAPSGRRRGLASDALRTTVRWLESRHVTDVHAVTAAANDASSALLTRLGFRPVGNDVHPKLGPSTQWALTLRDGRRLPGDPDRETPTDAGEQGHRVRGAGPPEPSGC